MLPSTELAFDEAPLDCQYGQKFAHATAIFRQVNRDVEKMHHDALEGPDGKFVLLSTLIEGQHATVLQLPAAPKNKAEAKEQTRLEVVG